MNIEAEIQERWLYIERLNADVDYTVLGEEGDKFFSLIEEVLAIAELFERDVARQIRYAISYIHSRAKKDNLLLVGVNENSYPVFSHFIGSRIVN